MTLILVNYHGKYEKKDKQIIAIVKIIILYMSIKIH